MFLADRYCLHCGAANPVEVGVCSACRQSLKITAPLPQEASRHGYHLLLQSYRILSQIGKGGFSAVYKAVDTLCDDHTVAVKAITLSGLRPQEVIEATEAFNREMTLLSALKHPDLPRIYDHFSDSECWYLVMDFIEGITLEKHLEAVPTSRLAVGEVLVPAILAVIFGHIGKRRARTIAGLLWSKEIAAAGMVIGYIFGAIYLAFGCLILFYVLLTRG